MAYPPYYNSRPGWGTSHVRTARIDTKDALNSLFASSNLEPHLHQAFSLNPHVRRRQLDLCEYSILTTLCREWL